MLELVSVSHVTPRKKTEPLRTLEHVSLRAPAGQVLAVVGAPDSGKTALLEILAGLQMPSNGSVIFDGQDWSEQPPHRNTIGYVPAGDDALNPVLTVRETVMSALLLRVAGLNRDERIGRSSHILVGVGLETVASHRVGTLSIPQRRRLKLAVALVSDPALVVCDDLLAGLDVRSEREMVALLKFVAGDHPARVVVHATRSLNNLSNYHTALVLHEGRACFHGPPRAITHYFSVPALDELYPRLAKRPAERWGESWARHRDSYYNAFKLGGTGSPHADDENDGDPERISLPANERSEDEEKSKPQPVRAPPPLPLPSFAIQARHLIHRRWTTLRRRQREFLCQIGMFIGMPLVAGLLIWPNAKYLKTAGSPGADELWPASYTCSMAIFVQVLLVLFMSVRNGSREIAGERRLFERERAGGLRAASYLIAKLGFLIPLVLGQIFALSLFIEITTGGLPGYVLARLLILALTGIAFTTLCLGISAHSRHPERAQSSAWMLAFLNITFAGALLGFPRVLGGVLQPFVTAYYGWSGSIDTLKNTPLFEPLTRLVTTWFAPPTLAMTALSLHFVVGVFLTATGLRRRQ